MNKLSQILKSKKVFIFGFAFVFFISAVVLAYNFFEGNSNSENESINIYFINSSTNEIVAEKRTIENGTALLNENKKQEYVSAVISEFMKGPKNVNLSSSVPENVSVIWCKFNETTNGNGNVEVNFSKEYNEISESQELSCRGALVKTFSEISFVESVNIIADGKNISRDNGQIISDMNETNVEVNPSIEPYKTDNLTVKLYFSDDNAMGLCAEERDIKITEKQSIETKIVEELIEGPQSENLVAVIPAETKVNNINTESGICYVDLSKEFVLQHNGGSTGELLTIYSIVNSLTELDYVKQVQFLIDGVKETSLAGHVDFSKTFERDESRILKD